MAFAEGRAWETGSSARFRRLNLYDYRQLLTVGAQLAHERPTDAVYAWFLVHALEDEGRHNLWRFGRSVLRGTRGRLYLEFRTEATEHEFGEHYRQFVQPETVAGELAGYGFNGHPQREPARPGGAPPRGPARMSHRRETGGVER